MLKQHEVDQLLAMEKRMAVKKSLEFPDLDCCATWEVKSTDGKHSFLVDANRRGKKSVLKCTYNERYAITEILLRLDIGPSIMLNHRNPDGKMITGPHLHIYKEGYADKWAYPVPIVFTNLNDLSGTLLDFLAYCKIIDMPAIQRGLF